MINDLKTGTAGDIRNRLTALSIALLLMAGCGGLTTSEQFYAFNDQRTAMPAADSADKLTSIAVDAVTVPEFVDRPQIVRRTSSQVVEVSEQNRWAEPLKIGIGRVTANELSSQLNRQDRPVRATAYPRNPTEDVDWRVTIDVVRIDATTNGLLNLELEWIVRGRNGSPRYGRSTYSCKSSPDISSLVTGWERLIRASAHDIATTINGSIAPLAQVDC